MFLSSQHLKETLENRGWTSTVQLQQTLGLRPASVTEMEMSAFNLDGSLPPRSLNNHLPKALLPTASLSSSTHPMGQEPQHHWTPSPRIHTNTGLQLGTNISATSISFLRCSTYFSHLECRLSSKDQSIFHLLACSRGFPSQSANVYFCGNSPFGSVSHQQRIPLFVTRVEEEAPSLPPASPFWDSSFHL